MPFIKSKRGWEHVPPKNPPGPANHPLSKVPGLKITWKTPVKPARKPIKKKKPS